MNEDRVVATLNRQYFVQLHRCTSEHSDIIFCTNDTNRTRIATRIYQALLAECSLEGKLMCVIRSSL